jgi:hypothetical protein
LAHKYSHFFNFNIVFVTILSAAAIEFPAVFIGGIIGDQQVETTGRHIHSWRTSEGDSESECSIGWQFGLLIEKFWLVINIL